MDDRADAHAIERLPVDASMRRERRGDADAVVDEQLVVVDGVRDVRRRRGLVGQAELRADAERERGEQAEAPTDRDRHRRQPVAVELRVEAVREERLALVGVERGRRRQVRERQHQEDADREAVLDEVLHAADDQVRTRLAARALPLPRIRGHVVVRALTELRPLIAALLEPLRRDDRVRERNRLRARRTVDDVAGRDRERHVVARRAPVERQRDLFGEHRDADVEAVLGELEHRGIEVRRRRARIAHDRRKPAGAVGRAERLEERGCVRAGGREEERAREEGEQVFVHGSVDR